MQERIKKDNVNWDYIEAWKQDPNPLGLKQDFQCVWIPYGLPEIIDPVNTMYGSGFEVQPKWKVADKVLITQTITGAFYSKRGNANHPTSRKRAPGLESRRGWAQRIRSQALSLRDRPDPQAVSRSARVRMHGSIPDGRVV